MNYFEANYYKLTIGKTFESGIRLQLSFPWMQLPWATLVPLASYEYNIIYYQFCLLTKYSSMFPEAYLKEDPAVNSPTMVKMM